MKLCISLWFQSLSDMEHKTQSGLSCCSSSITLGTKAINQFSWTDILVLLGYHVNSDPCFGDCVQPDPCQSSIRSTFLSMVGSLSTIQYLKPQDKGQWPEILSILCNCNKKIIKLRKKITVVSYTGDVAEFGSLIRFISDLSSFGSQDFFQNQQTAHVRIFHQILKLKPKLCSDECKSQMPFN